MTVPQKIKTVQKRIDHLQKRIDSSPINLSFDKQEVSALKWALELAVKSLNNDTENVPKGVTP